jgi:hypothetical protein
MVHLVALQRMPKQTMREFLAAIAKHSLSYVEAMGNVWLVHSDKSAARLFRSLRPFVTAPDSLLVIAVQGEYGALLDRPAVEWLRESRALKEFGD